MKNSGGVPLLVWALLAGSAAVACIAGPSTGQEHEGEVQAPDATLPVGHPKLDESYRDGSLEGRRLQVNCGACHQGTK